MDRQTPVLTSDEFGKFFSEYKNRFVSIAYGYVHDTDIAKDIGKHGKIDPVGTDEIDPVKTA